MGHESVHRVAGPFQIHGRLREVLTRDLDVPVLPLLEATDSTVLRRVGRPPRASKDFYSMDRVLVFQRQIIDRGNDGALGGDGMLLSGVVHRTDDQRRITRRRGLKWFPVCCLSRVSRK